MGTEHHVYVRSALNDPLSVLLRQAATHRDLEVWLGRPKRFQSPEIAVEPVVRVLSNATGVEHDHVGVGDIDGFPMKVASLKGTFSLEGGFATSKMWDACRLTSD